MTKLEKKMVKLEMAMCAVRKAEEMGNKLMHEAAVTAIHEWKMEYLVDHAFAEVANAYLGSKEEGCPILNFWAVHDPKAIVQCLRQSDVREFTFSSQRTDALEQAFEFQQAGAKIAKATEINWDGNPTPALLFVM